MSGKVVVMNNSGRVSEARIVGPSLRRLFIRFFSLLWYFQVYLKGKGKTGCYVRNRDGDGDDSGT